jgi:hypothetical protein
MMEYQTVGSLGRQTDAETSTINACFPRSLATRTCAKADCFSARATAAFDGNAATEQAESRPPTQIEAGHVLSDLISLSRRSNRGARRFAAVRREVRAQMYRRVRPCTLGAMGQDADGSSEKGICGEMWRRRRERTLCS